MKIVSQSPLQVVPAPTDTVSVYNIVDYPSKVESVPTQLDSDNGELANEKSKFSRIFDLIKKAEKKGKLKSGDQDARKRKLALLTYARVAHADEDEYMKGTLCDNIV